MKVVTKTGLIAGIAKRYGQSYYNSKMENWGQSRFGMKLSHREQYELLKETTTEDEIKEIIGNYSWTDNKCDECGRDVQAIVIIGEEPGCESNTAQVCLECLEKAVAFIKGR